MLTRAFKTPQTVPNSPTNGAVEPTVASRPRPPWSLLFTWSTARCSDMVIHSCRSMRSVRRPSWWEAARRPSSAMERKSSPFFSRSTPSLMDGAVQNCFSTTRADCFSLRWSQSLVSITYQEASDMISSRISTARAMMSPVCHRAARPYGLSVETVAWFSIVFLGKTAPQGAVSGSFGHLEADAEFETVIDGLAVLAARHVATGPRQAGRPTLDAGGVR